ncbi:helix-turn-helix domain-containing protein [Actinoplanes sp. NPDC023714]
MLRRFRYRVYPDARQEQLLAKAFGCARRVFNDGLQARLDAGLP